MPLPPSPVLLASRPLGRPRSTAAALALLVPTLVVSLGLVVSAQSSPGPTTAPTTVATPAATQAAAARAAPASELVRWEYRTLFVTWDSNILNWVADFSDGTRVEGLDPILNNEGRNGWELVAVVPELWTQIVDDAIREDARRLRIFLKKPLG